MSVKKDYVLQVARVLLLDPLTMDFKTYDEANKHFAVCECLWNGLDKEHFPGLDLLKETLKNLSIESQHPGVEGLSIAFMYNFMKKGKKDDKDVYRAWVKNLTAHYTSVCDMDKDFGGEPWDESAESEVNKNQIKDIIQEEIKNQDRAQKTRVKALVLDKTTPLYKALNEGVKRGYFSEYRVDGKLVSYYPRRANSYYYEVVDLLAEYGLKLGDICKAKTFGNSKGKLWRTENQAYKDYYYRNQRAEKK